MAIQAQDAIQTIIQTNGTQPCILIVDDEAGSAEAIELYLTRHGYLVDIAHTGQSAIDKINQRVPDLLIVDLNMPKMSGLDLTIQVRQDPKINYLPVIIVTAQDEERKRLQSMVSGADDYLLKPIIERDLLVRVQALLRTKAEIDKLTFQRETLLKDLKQQNMELEQALREVEDAQLLKKNILNSVSHEMGTPMLQIKSAVHLLIEDARKTNEDSTPAELATQAITRMEAIIQNLTDLAQMENLRFDTFVLKDAVDLGIRYIERSWVAKNAVGRIHREIAPDLPLVFSSRRGVSRILHLLLENALKFDPDNNPIKIIAKQHDDQHVYLAVKDQGIGIPADKLEDIFKEFYQVDSTTTRRFGGSGVGLALVKLLVERMDLQINVKSKLKKGSTFSLLLPISKLDLE